MKKYINHIKRLWTDSCDIIETVYIKNDMGIMEPAEKFIYKDINCMLSYKTYKRDRAGVQRETVTELQREVRLLLPPNISLKAGSKFIVRHRGEERVFVSSGIPALYPSHIEIMVCESQLYA